MTKKETFKWVVQIIASIATAILTAMGTTSCMVLDEKSVLEFDFQNALALFCFWGAGCDNYGKLPASCYKTDLFVSTTSGEILEKSCNGLKSVITLHRQSDKTSIFDLMIQTKYKGVIISTPECLLHQSLP